MAILGKGVKRWMGLFVAVVGVEEVEVLAGAVDAVTARRTGSAGVVNAVAAAAVDSSHASRSRFSQALFTASCTPPLSRLRPSGIRR